jgi:hypothetical protein
MSEKNPWRLSEHVFSSVAPPLAPNLSSATMDDELQWITSGENG